MLQAIEMHKPPIAGTLFYESQGFNQLKKIGEKTSQLNGYFDGIVSMIDVQNAEGKTTISERIRSITPIISYDVKRSKIAQPK